MLRGSMDDHLNPFGACDCRTELIVKRHAPIQLHFGIRTTPHTKLGAAR
jgi:hypothetical protein